MSISNGCAIIVGLPFRELESLIGYNQLMNLIYDGNLDAGSIYFTSPNSDNVVGKIIKYSENFNEIEMCELGDEEDIALAYLYRYFGNTQMKMYLTLHTT